MMMTEDEFKKMMLNHPQLKVTKRCKKTTQTDDKEKTQERHKEKKSNKYRNVKRYVYENGLVSDDKTLKHYGKIIEVFDSTKEYNRWAELLALQKIGKISDLDRQKTLIIQERFKYREKTIQAITYKADFAYIENGTTVIEDVKTFDEATQRFRMTEAFKIKWKLLMSKYQNFDFRLY